MGRLRLVLVAAAVAVLVPAGANGAARAGVVQQTEASIGGLRTVAAAEAAGYRPLVDGHGLVHFANEAYAADGRVLDPRRPEALMFLRTDAGDRLVGAMFMMPTAGDRGPAIKGAHPGWHTHSYCWGPGGLGVPTPGGPCPRGTAPTTSPAMLHVWFVKVAGGPFAVDMSPTYACRATPLSA